jgi:tetratricopeptide (TPR) repeat protein
MDAERRKEQALELIDNAELLRRDGQIKAAIAMYQEATKLDPGLWKAYFGLASVYRDGRMRHEELNTLRKALTVVQTDHEKAATLNNLNDVLSFFGDVEQARICMEQAVALEPQNALWWSNLYIPRLANSTGRGGLAANWRLRW